MNNTKPTDKEKQTNRGKSVANKATKNQPVTDVDQRLTPKEHKFVQAIIEGKSKRQAGLMAGSKTEYGADRMGQRLSKKVQVQQAIANALESHGATPEFAVGRLKKIAEQDEELGASRLASKDILELHGWNKNSGNNVTLEIKQAFFKQTRRPNVVDVDEE